MVRAPVEQGLMAFEKLLFDSGTPVAARSVGLTSSCDLIAFNTRPAGNLPRWQIASLSPRSFSPFLGAVVGHERTTALSDLPRSSSFLSSWPMTIHLKRSNNRKEPFSSRANQRALNRRTLTSRNRRLACLRMAQIPTQLLSSRIV
jgi:hypothetical protein